jgi:hypothetical protein
VGSLPPPPREVLEEATSQENAREVADVKMPPAEETAADLADAKPAEETAANRLPPTAGRRLS